MPSKLPKGYTPMMEGWTPRQWLGWFLANHDLRPLIPLGVWKRPKFILEDFEDEDEAINAVRAAWMLGGEEGGLAVLCELLQSQLPEGFEPSPLPEGWADTLRYRGEEWRSSDRPPKWGKFRKDTWDK